jgi:hypothetical protein
LRFVTEDPRVVLIGPEQGDIEIQAFTNLSLSLLDYASTGSTAG